MESDGQDLIRKLQVKIQKHKECSGYGFLLRDGQKVMCSCRQEAMFQFRLAQSGIPPKFKTMGFRDYLYQNSEAYKSVQDYLGKANENRQDGMGLYLYGPNYTGKSLLACSLLIDLMKAGYDCKFFYFDGLLDVARNTDSGNGGGKNLLSSLATEWDFLCLDRVGDVLNQLSKFRSGVITGERIHGAVEFLRSIISTRVHAGRPVIITSTISLKDMDQVFPGLSSTLIGSCIHVLCEDKGYKAKRMEQLLDD